MVEGCEVGIFEGSEVGIFEGSGVGTFVGIIVGDFDTLKYEVGEHDGHGGQLAVGATDGGRVVGGELQLG